MMTKRKAMESKSLTTLIIRIILAFSMSLLLAQCSDDQESKIEEAVESEGEKAEEDLKDAAKDAVDEYDEEEDYEEDTESDSETADTQEDDAEASADVLGDMQSEDGEGEATDDVGMADNAEPIMPEADPLATGADPGEVATTDNTDTMDTSSQAPAAAPQEGFRTYFVRSNAASTFSDEGKTQQSGTYTRGETLLVNITGEWGQLQDGRFIKATDLTSKPVGRKKPRGSWK